MPHRFLVAVLVDVRRKQLQASRPKCSMQKAGQVGTSGASTAASSSTRLQVETIMHSVTPGIAARARVVSGRSSRRDGDPLPQRDGRGLVVHANERQCHGAPNLCTWLKRLAAQTAIITTNTAPER